MGRRYAIDLPEPVSEASRHSRHSAVSEKRYFSDNAWIRVGDADGPSTWIRESRRPSSKGGDEKEVASAPESRDFDMERSNSSARGLTTLTAGGDPTTPFEKPEARLEDGEESCFVAGIWKDFPRVAAFLSILLTRRESLLANLPAVGSGIGSGASLPRFSCRPACGGEPRENSGAATSSLPPFFDRGVRSLTRRVRDGSKAQVVVSHSLHKSNSTTNLCVKSGIEADKSSGPSDMAKTLGDRIKCVGRLGDSDA